jgi:integrase
MRISDLAGLRWSAINLQANTIRVAEERTNSRKRNAGTARTTKDRRSRTIPVHPRLSDLLKPLERHSDGFVFRETQGNKLLSANVLTSLINRVIRPLKETFPTPSGEVVFEHGRLHSLRHTDSKRVDHYRHLRDEDSQRKMKQIAFLRDSEDTNRKENKKKDEDGKEMDGQDDDECVGEVV